VKAVLVDGGCDHLAHLERRLRARLVPGLARGQAEPEQRERCGGEAHVLANPLLVQIHKYKGTVAAPRKELVIGHEFLNARSIIIYFHERLDGAHSQFALLGSGGPPPPTLR
jgi:hypothetical protein